MLTVTKSFKWDMAHMLEDHEGLCLNLHGHTYRMDVTVKATTSDAGREAKEKGMVVDFGNLSQLVKDVLINDLDHSTMINHRSNDVFELELFSLMDKYRRKNYVVNYRPTAENMAVAFYDILYDAILTEFGSKCKLAAVEIWETATASAVYMGGNNGNRDRTS